MESILEQCKVQAGLCLVTPMFQWSTCNLFPMMEIVEVRGDTLIVVQFNKIGGTFSSDKHLVDPMLSFQDGDQITYVPICRLESLWLEGREFKIIPFHHLNLVTPLNTRNLRQSVAVPPKLPTFSVRTSSPKPTFATFKSSKPSMFNNVVGHGRPTATATVPESLEFNISGDDDILALIPREMDENAETLLESLESLANSLTTPKLEPALDYIPLTAAAFSQPPPSLPYGNSNGLERLIPSRSQYTRSFGQSSSDAPDWRFRETKLASHIPQPARSKKADITPSERARYHAEQAARGTPV